MAAETYPNITSYDAFIDIWDSASRNGKKVLADSLSKEILCMSAVSGPNTGRTVAHVLAGEELLPARYIAPPDLDILSMSYSTENSPCQLPTIEIAGL